MRGANPGSIIRVSAVVLRDDDGGVLTVRKRNTGRFMLPGGKPEAGETSTAAAIREVAEELAVELDAARLTLFGVFTAEAANEPGRIIEATVYTHPWVAVRGTAAEFEELRWQPVRQCPYPGDLAPLLVDHVLPAMLGR